MTDAPVTRWVEPCAGMLAVALRLRGGAGCVPPIAYLGGKQTFAGSLLAGLGIRSGSGCRDLWVADAGPPGRVWEALASDPGRVLAMLDEWAPGASTEAGGLALYRELVADDATHTGRSAAGWLLAAGWSYRAGDTRSGWKPPHHKSPFRAASVVAARVRAVVATVAGACVWHDARLWLRSPDDGPLARAEGLAAWTDRMAKRWAGMDVDAARVCAGAWGVVVGAGVREVALAVGAVVRDAARGVA